MILKRLGAVVGAVAMIVAAVAVRGLLDGGGDGPDGRDRTLVVACVEDLRSVCEQFAAASRVEVRIERDTATIAALVDPDAVDAARDGELVDAWLAPAPAVAMVNDERARLGLEPVLGDPSSPLARTPLVLVGWRDRLSLLREHCGGQLTWSCIGENADTPWNGLGGSATWGSLKPGHADPAHSTDGLLVLSQAVASRVGRTDYASNDFGDSAFRSWFERLERTVDDLASGPGHPLTRMLSFGVSSYDVVGTTEALAGPAVRRSRDRDRLEMTVAEPVTTLDLVAVPVLGAAGDDAVDELRSAELADLLSEAGWRTPDRPLADGLVPDLELPATDGTPAGGVLVALRSLLEEVR
jgi:hypothetical protein